MRCLRCRARIRYVAIMSWWACNCRVWTTDEHIDARTG
jgi:hypothetical protein